MPDDIEKINEIFRSHDEHTVSEPIPAPPEEPAGRRAPLKAVDHLMIDSTGGAARATNRAPAVWAASCISPSSSV